MQLCPTRPQHDTIPVTTRPYIARSIVREFDIVIHIDLTGNFIECYGRIATVLNPCIYFKICSCEHRTAKYYEDEVKGTVDSDYVVLKQRQYTFAGDFQDDTIALIDSDYVQARQSLDSSAVTGLIDSAYIQLRQLGADLIDSATVLNLSIANLSEDSSPTLGGDLNMNGFSNTYAFNLGASGSSAYTFSDTRNRFFPTTENNPTLYLRRGDAYIFINGTGAHPLEIQDSDSNSYDTGVTNNRDSAGTGNVTIVPSMSAPLRLRYQCTSHDSMGGIINIV